MENPGVRGGIPTTLTNQESRVKEAKKEGLILRSPDGHEFILAEIMILIGRLN